LAGVVVLLADGLGGSVGVLVVGTGAVVAMVGDVPVVAGVVAEGLVVVVVDVLVDGVVVVAEGVVDDVVGGVVEGVVEEVDDGVLDDGVVEVAVDGVVVAAGVVGLVVSVEAALPQMSSLVSPVLSAGLAGGVDVVEGVLVEGVLVVGVAVVAVVAGGVAVMVGEVVAVGAVEGAFDALS
jgi:hypothetical protein